MIKVEDQIGRIVFGSDQRDSSHKPNETSNYVLVLAREWRSGTDALAQSFRNTNRFTINVDTGTKCLRALGGELITLYVPGCELSGNERNVRKIRQWATLQVPGKHLAGFGCGADANYSRRYDVGLGWAAHVTGEPNQDQRAAKMC